MLKELEQQLEWKVQNSAEGYWRLGGRLNEQSFDKAISLLSKLTTGENPLPMRESSLVQAKNMAEFSKVPITHEQKYLYAALREMTEKTDEISDSLPETQRTVPWKLFDQPLLAEVLLLTGETTKYNDFKSAYPNIFLETK
jgi:hypothetical protein